AAWRGDGGADGRECGPHRQRCGPACEAQRAPRGLPGAL
ncbi:MAG: hypothetical protein AVDCRST_MAG18-2451, partial [uncultured Thermomicrobiales bacterium]